MLLRARCTSTDSPVWARVLVTAMATIANRSETFRTRTAVLILRSLRELCVPAVMIGSNTLTAETLRTQRRRRELGTGSVCICNLSFTPGLQPGDHADSYECLEPFQRFAL